MASATYSPMEKDGSTTDDDSATVALMDHDRELHTFQKRSRWDRTKELTRRPLMIANVILFLVSLRGYWLWWHSDVPKTDSLLKQSSYYSPLLNLMEDIPRVSRMSFGEYGDGGDTALWRGPPSDELDEAWERLIPDRPILPITKADILAMNKDPSVAVKMPKKYWRGDGEQTFMAKPSAFHNLHCLDYVRRTVYKDYYWPNGTDDVPFHDTHVTHCIMLLKEHLTCAPDPGVTVFRWLDEFSIPIVDTNIWRKCWDFDTVLEQYDAASVIADEVTLLPKPAGVQSTAGPQHMVHDVAESLKNHPEWSVGMLDMANFPQSDNLKHPGH